jgi:hypothetical protein
VKALQALVDRARLFAGDALQDGWRFVRGCSLVGSTAQEGVEELQCIGACIGNFVARGGIGDSGFSRR